MIKGLYCIYDDVAKETNGPFVANNDAHAHLLFEMNIKKIRDAGFEQEFKLLKVASIDLSTGQCYADGEIVDITYTFEEGDING